jgi:hypothetical protein
MGAEYGGRMGLLDMEKLLAQKAHEQWLMMKLVMIVR